MTQYNKKYFSSFSVKVGMAFSKIPLSPNQWTSISIVPAILGFISAFYGNIFIAVILFAITAFIDIIDGSVARVIGRVTTKGAYISMIAERYVEILMILSVLFIGLPNLYFPLNYWLIVLVFGSVMSTYVNFIHSEDKLKKKEGFFIHAEWLILMFIVFIISVFSDKLYATYIIALIALLSNLSALHGIYYTYKSTRE
ncbi:CDP-alcohol phosphatidyltransferase family protein [archaeon]|nr:CDP-alcohol phosphatidyltransferase family protein [archaeon]